MTIQQLRRDDPVVDDQSSAWNTVERVVCAITLALLGWRGVFHYQVSYAVLIGLALVPIWFGALKKFKGGPPLVVAGLAALVGGLLLTATATGVGRTVTSTQFLIDFGLIVVMVVGVGLLLWARTLMSRQAVAIWFGLGLMVRLIETGLDTDNPWKFAFAVPTTIIVLAVVDALRNPVWTLAAMVVLGLISAFLDSRSLFGTFLLAIVLVLWQLRPSKMGRPASWAAILVLGVGLGAAAYRLASALLVDGYFGLEAQQRTEAQINSAGSLILGGRPEIAATVGLMAHTPFGFGFGVGPDVTDIAAAKTGMLAINYKPDNNYVNIYMFDGHVELHSAVGDLWARAGLLGLVLVVVIGVLITRNLADSMHRREASGLMMFLSVYTGWNFFFSPQSSGLPTLMLTLGLGMIALAPAIGPRLQKPGMTTRPGRMQISAENLTPGLAVHPARAEQSDRSGHRTPDR